MPGTASALYISVHFQTVIAAIQERMIHRNMAVFTLEDEQVMDDLFWKNMSCQRDRSRLPRKRDGRDFGR